MKKLSIIAVSLLALTSCQRQRCWECTEQHPLFVTKMITCDKTRQEIKDLEAMWAERGLKLDCEVKR